MPLMGLYIYVFLDVDTDYVSARISFEKLHVAILFIHCTDKYKWENVLPPMFKVKRKYNNWS